MKHAQSELIRLAAEMALAKGMPSPYLEDHAFYVSTPMAEQSTPERWMKWCDSKALDKIDELRGDLAAAERGHDAAHAACVKYDAEVERLRGLLREGHEGGYFDAPSGFYERVDAALKENAT